MTDKLFRLGLAAFLLSATVRAASGDHAFTQSIAPMGAAGSTMVGGALTGQELASVINFDVALRMRDWDELEARLQAGQKISPTEMEAKYLPLLSDYNRISIWLTAEGFPSTLADPHHTNLFVQGSVEQITRAFGVKFARVSTPDGVFISAVSAPVLPAEIAGPVLSVDGLQPHLRSHPPHRRSPLRTNIVTSVGSGFFTPGDVAAAYHIPASLTGSGQTIAIIIDTAANPTDLTLFWNTIQSAQTVNNFTTVPVNGTAGTGDIDEASLDVEWAGSIAPAAKIRLYTIPSLTNTNVVAALSQILTDASANHITVVSMSFGQIESQIPGGTVTVFSQLFAQMTANGITPCASSGDGGSSPLASGPNAGFYGGSSVVPVVEHPACDPNVTGVGGTSMGFDISNNYNELSETTWFQNASGGIQAASGGGVSTLFTRPVWQVGNGLPAVGGRFVPDVAAISDGLSGSSQFGGFIVVNGKLDPNNQGVPDTEGAGGTSLSVQVFGALVALSNQARANVGLGAAGAINPLLYPLNGSNTFTDITTGNNGAFSAGAGYDQCTGLGSPNMSNFVVGVGGVLPPTISSQPQSTSVATGGSFSFTVGATGGSLSYQWFLNNAAISGATSATYSKSGASSSDGGTYTVTATNIDGSVTSNGATLSVNPAAAVAPASGGGGGGGGAPSLWFYGALALACGLRWTQRRPIQRLS